MISGWKIRGRHLVFERTWIMGILNLTPDSFSDGGQYLSTEAAIRCAEEMIAQGADILDLGAESTRPGAKPVREAEELQRLLPCLEYGVRHWKIPISVDTTKPAVARRCLETGAHIINDVSGLKDSGAEMAAAVKDFEAGLVVMHRRGNPQTMQQLTEYGDLIQEVLGELSESLELAQKFSLDSQQLVIDPGLGFAKNTEQNLLILKNLEKFQQWGRPILLGPSRKSFLGEITGRGPAQRDAATAAVCALAVNKGISILRVHEVAAARDAICVAEMVRGREHVRS